MEPSSSVTVKLQTNTENLVSRSGKMLSRPNGHHTMLVKTEEGTRASSSVGSFSVKGRAALVLVPIFQGVHPFPVGPMLLLHLFLFIYLGKLSFCPPSRPFDCSGRFLVPFLRFGVVQRSCSMIQFGGLAQGSGGILKLHEDVQTCGYKDVQVMFDMLTSELEAAAQAEKPPPSPPPPVWPGRSSSTIAAAQ
ncbi:uncharacterized protein C2845_PM13G07450 [Panicum miliaceum]|uniref:Uncharacterized protein n=1 Tax=Panicum miliaceum TaxID=4540 RepID=A0A3L6RLN1_PANMI|nr:uncharacterized protein C2845_PM13G07450 [Panicum miliaceum]